VKGIYMNRSNDARFLVPILSGLEKQDILNYLPRLIQLQSKMVKTVMEKLLNFKSSISPSELMVGLHLIDTKVVPMKKVMEAIQFCFDMKTVFKQEVLAIVLQQLVAHTPVPPLFMRTVITTFSSFSLFLSK
jgi:symplekin